MDFYLSEEQDLIRQAMREFAQEYVAPIAQEIDESSRWPADLYVRLGEKGWMGMPFPEEYGGSGADYVSYAGAIEELAQVCAATAFNVSVHTGVACMCINNFGTDEQKKEYLTPLAKGKIGAFAITEPSAGTDVGGALTNAVLDGDEYVINGSKTFCTNGPVADTYVVFAWTNKEKGEMSCFIIPRDTPGMQIGHKIEKMGMRSSQTSDLYFKDCRVPKANIIGKEGQGLKIAMNGFDHGRVGIAAQAVGIAQAALDEAIAYSKQRVQFGKPIAKQQQIQFWIADMVTEIQAARLLTLQAAWLKDQGKPFSKEAAMAKLYASELAVRVTNKAVQIHGGYGYCKGIKVERLYRDAKITEIYEGTSEAMKMVIGGSTLR